MNSIFKVFLVFSCLSLMVMGCDGAGLDELSELDSGTDTTGDDSAASEITAVTFTDELGAEIGDTIVPTKAIIATADAPIANANVTMVCDGEDVALDVTVLSNTEIRIMASSDHFPQLTECELNIGVTAQDVAQDAAKVAVTVGEVWFKMTAKVSCDETDFFANPATIDVDAEPLTYGEGCWQTFSLTEEMGSAEIRKQDGRLLLQGLAGSTDSKGMLILKRMAFGDAEISLHPDSVSFEAMLDENEEQIQGGVTYGILISENAEIISFEPKEGDPIAQMVWVGYSRGLNVEEVDGSDEVIRTPRFRCLAGASNIGRQIVWDGCGDGSIAPVVGFVIEGDTYSPYVSFDGGKTKQLIHSGDSDATVFDMTEELGALDDLDVAIIAVGDHAVVGNVLIDDFIVDGEAEIVDRVVN